ncbi:MAG: alpha-1,2-fucosyltransferase [Chitinophagaceae bacterium]|nr:MAG: alpha-1,2-fucosyltransferase [Chitinophagaceae bacterium]
MYYFQLMGGLGNQLFQYAAAKALSLKTDVPVKVYYNDGNMYAKRSYELAKFNTQVALASEDEIPKTTLLGKLKRKLRITSFFTENEQFRFDPSFFEQPLHTHFYGYWQNEAYFKDYREVILHEYQVKSPLTKKNAQYLHHIEEVNSVAVHVRRGDYIDNPEAYANHGTLELAYYKKAIEFFEENHQTNHYFIFSDDPNWVKENMDFIAHKTIIDWNLDQPEEDLRLMSNCKHQITANSSFSWWGAWLNINPDKVVIAPKKWTNRYTNCNVLPKAWIQI